MRQKKYDPIRGIGENIGLASMESIGYSIPYQIAGTMTGESAVIGAHVATVGSSLAGLPTLIHGSSNLLKSMSFFDMKNMSRRRRR
jgi:hypothetical protein